MRRTAHALPRNAVAASVFFAVILKNCIVF
nr:MAG TPA: hypothetical protein [Caudoviricetes sp.]